LASGDNAAAPVIEPTPAFPVDRRNEGLATASLVTGITSLVCCGLVTGIPAIVMGVLARNRIAKSAGTLGGAGMAIAGVILGIAGSALWTFVIVAGILVYSLNLTHQATATAIPCDLLERTVYHYHVAVQIFDEGTEVPIPTDVGRPGTCYYWLHMHASSPGVIHVESPDARAYTLGDFFDVWAKSSSGVRLDSRHVGTIALSAGQTLIAFVDGSRNSQDPRGIVLVSHRVIQLEITPPEIPPPIFTFPSGL
jgi:hypothetical protein